MLSLERKELYQVKEGQTLEEIARAFCVSARLLVKENRLTKPPLAGTVLMIPSERGNLYTAREGDTKAVLCGSDENFVKKNGTHCLYLGMRVVL